MTPPNSSVQIAKSVYENGALKIYDSAGNLIRTRSNITMQFPEVAQAISETMDTLSNSGTTISSVMSCLRANSSFSYIIDMINNPPPSVTITQMNSNLFAVRMPVDSNFASHDATWVVSIVDTTDKLLMASRLYDVNDVIQNSVMYDYDNCNLIGFKQEIRESFPDCTDASFQVIGRISNINFVVH